MQTTTAKWPKALAASHTATIYCEVWDRGEKVVSRLQLIDGTVTDKWTSGIRRNIDVTVPATPRWRELFSTPLIELRPYRGINYGTGAPEVKALGRFPVLYDADNADPRQPLSINADDRWQTVLADDFYAPTVSGTGLISDEIVKLVGQVGFTVTNTATSTAKMTLRLYEASRHDTIMELCASIGAEIYPDRSGNIVLRDRLASSAPSFTVQSGDAGTMIALTGQRDWRKVYNVIVVRPTAANVAFAPVVVAITDPNDPAHPSKIGRRVYRWDTPSVGDVGQARSAGMQMLRKLSAPQRTLSVAQVPNAAVDASDCLAAIWPDGTYEVAQVDQVTHPLSPDAAQQISTVLNRPEEL